MKIVARIRQQLNAKEDIVADGVEDVPRPIEAPPKPTLRRATERPATPVPSPRPPLPPPLPRVALNKAGCRLEGEGIEQPITNPSEDIIRRELERLRSSGPSHLALIATDGSYLQVAGNAKRMTVEGHLVSARRTTHVVLGRQVPPGPAATVVATFGPIEVRSSEVWTATEAADLFAAFVATDSLAPDLSRRDITATVSSP